MTFRSFAHVLVATGMAVLLAGCGSVNSKPQSQISVAFTAGFAPPSSMNGDSTVSIAATVANDPSNQGVHWTVSCGSGPCGSFNPTSTGSAMSTQFSAPLAVAGNGVTVTATSVADNTKSVSATITIAQGASISVTIAPVPRAEMNVTSTASFTAVVDNDSAGAGVNWSVICGSSQCGSITPGNPFASGSAATYQAPPTIPAGGTVTLTATSVTDSTKSASAIVTINQAPTTLQDGTYVFHLSGSDFTTANGGSNYYVVGAFTVAGGLITGGEQDFVDFNDALNDSINPGTSSISGTADGNLQIVLDTGNTDIGVNGIETLDASFVNGTRALIGENDAFAASTGTLDLQTSQAGPSGGYAFFATGIDRNFNPVAFGGVVNVDGSGSISGGGSVLDFNDASSAGILSDQTLNSSTVSATPDSFGRVVFTLNPSDGNIGQIVLIGYVVDAATIPLIETLDTFGSTTGGMARAQGANTGAFTNSSIAGSTYVVGVSGIDANGNLELAGAIAFSSTSNNVSGSATLSDIVTELSGNISGGTYLVDATGRVTLTALTAPTFNNANVQAYLDGSGNAFVVSMDMSDVVAGYAFQQVPGASFRGSYAAKTDGGTLLSSASVSSNHRPKAHPDATSKTFVPWSVIGQIFADNSGNVTGFTNFNLLAQSLTPNVQLYGTATGAADLLTGTLTGVGVDSLGAESFTYYVIDDFRAFAIETDASQLSLAYFEQSSH
jgi:hypothetical protein